VARILNDMAAEDAAHGWRQGGPASLQKQRASAMRAGSGSGSRCSCAAGSRKRKALVAVPTANVWAKTQLLLHSLAATSDAFHLMVNDLSSPTALVGCIRT
jgi:hypothetical protein